MSGYLVLYFIHQWQSKGGAPRTKIFLITARKRSLGKGNIFIGACQEFCPQGGAWSWGVCSQGGGCVSAPEGCLLPGGVPWSRGDVCSGGCLLPGCLLPGGCLVRGVGVFSQGVPGGYCCGRYASYWNAFLFYTVFGKICMLTPSPGGLAPPFTGNPGSAPVHVYVK